MIKLSIQTKKNNEVIDITEELNSSLTLSEGLVHVFIHHTTACITTADLDPGTDLDMLDAFNAMIPDLEYRHPHDPSHVGDHIMSSIIGPDVWVPVREGKCDLGTWQRIVLIEFDGPRERGITISEVLNK